MLFALGMMATSFGAMVVAAAQETQTVSTVTCTSPLPPEFLSKPFDAGRLTAAPNGTLTVSGVLPHYVALDVFKTVSPPAYVKEIDELEVKTRAASVASPVTYAVKTADFTFPLDAEAGVTFDGKALVFTKPMSAPTKTVLEGAAAPKAFRDSIESLEKKSQDARVSGLWLLLSYLLATIGELCLSPVGLSMVTKLAPRRFASLFMGVWMLTSSVAQYAGGSIGESWGKITPTSYFILFVGTSIVGAVFLAVLAIPAKKLMYEVH
jgi:POT family proton-dependent oligopeptide transporter